jgi:four helix bundle protein
LVPSVQTLKKVMAVAHKEYMYFLKVSRGSARESKGWYERSVKLLSQEIVDKRVDKLDQIIAMETKSIQTLELKFKAR